MYFQITVAEIWSALLILFDLLKNAVCIPCPIKNNFEFEASLFQQIPAVVHWPPGHSVTPIRPLDYLSTPWMVQSTPGGRYRPLWEPLFKTDLLFIRYLEKQDHISAKVFCISKNMHSRTPMVKTICLTNDPTMWTGVMNRNVRDYLVQWVATPRGVVNHFWRGRE